MGTNKRRKSNARKYHHRKSTPKHPPLHPELSTIKGRVQFFLGKI